MYMCICTNTFIYNVVHLYVYTHINIHIYIYTYICFYTHMHTHRNALNTHVPREARNAINMCLFERWVGPRIIDR